MAIAARYCLMIEPFRDLNADLWLLMNVLRRGYFQGRIAELRYYRLEPVLALDGYPKEGFLKTCAALSKRRPA
jgi:hypothetical protein